MILKLAFVLFILMILIGGDRGVKSCVTLILNVVIGIVSIYMVGLGTPTFLVLFVSSMLFCLLTIFYQNDYNIKTLASFLAVISVVLLTSVLIIYVCYYSHISGLNEIELQEEDVAYLCAAVSFHMRDVLIIAMIWCQLGAIIDTSIAVSSSLNEIHNHNPEFPIQRLFKEGVLVGKDILGTTLNTLYFVALGESIMLFIYYENFQYSFQKILNSSSFFHAIFPVLLPCIGCVIIIPLTAFIFSILIKHPKVLAHFEKKSIKES